MKVAGSTRRTFTHAELEKDEPEKVAVADPVVPVPATEPEPGAGQARRRRGPVVSGAVAVVMAALAGWFAIEARDATAVAAHNTALADVAATAEVTDQVGKALATIFSYRYDEPGKSEQAAKQVLTGPALTQYDQLFAQVKKLAAEQKLVVTSSAVTSGVKLLDGDHAALLVFLDQTGVRGDGRRSTGAAQLSVTAERTGDRWRVTALAAA
ncbi:membrane protein [Amycolatopsis samaneae]